MNLGGAGGGTSGYEQNFNQISPEVGVVGIKTFSKSHATNKSLTGLSKGGLVNA